MIAWPRGEPAVFRRMMREDLDAVMAIERESYRFGWTRGIFEDCLRIGYECWVMLDGADVVAYGIMSFAPGEAHILNICVGLRQQRHGHGRTVMEHLISIAVEHGAGRMWLEVRPSNEAARRLYRTLGFRQVARRRAYYPEEGGREDALVLSRRLNVPLR